MSDELRTVYDIANKSDRFFDKITPVDLFRGKKKDDTFDLLQPTLIGWMTHVEPRLPDILVHDSRGVSPQYHGGQAGGAIVTEPRSKPTTAQIISDASAYVVKGCRTIRGDHRGVSVFDMANTALSNFDWFKLPANTPIPDSLAVTRDADRARPGKPTHYTIAPKDDMPLSLFLQHLKGMAAAAKAI